jgi:hypothetical protein
MDTIPDKPPPGWVTESLERSEDQIASGQTVPLESVLGRLRASIARMKAGRPQAEPKTARKA